MGEVEQINIKSQTYYHNNDIIDFKNLDVRLLKIDKNHTKSSVFITLDILRLEKLMIVKILTV